MFEHLKVKVNVFVCILITISIFFTFIIPTNAKELLNKETILEKMKLANSYFLKKYPDPASGADKDPKHPGNIWTKATYLQGVLAMYKVTNDPQLYDYAVAWGEAFKWDLKLGNLTTDADNQCCMQVYEELYQIDPIDKRLSNVKICLDNMCSKPKLNYWSWIDAIFMSMPAFIKLGSITGDNKYYNKAYELFNYSKNTAGLYDVSTHLWWRDADFVGKNIYWSRGNGWVFAALARVLDILPETDPHYNSYKTTFIEMAEAIKSCQREDGFWNPDLLNPDNFGGKETSGTALFTYAMAWGVNNKILDKKIFLPCILKGWNCMANDALHSNGFLGWVQSTGKQPSDGQPLSYDKIPNFEDYALGAFLLAGSELYKLEN